MSSLHKRRRYVASAFGGDENTFTGLIVIDGDLEVIDKLTVKGPTDLEGTVDVVGNATFGASSVATFNGTSEFIGQVNMSAVGGHSLEVLRETNIFGATTIDNNLTLTGGGNLDVAGTSHLRGATEVGAVGANVNLTHNGTLRVRSDGNATLELLGTADNGTIETKGTDGITMRTEGGEMIFENSQGSAIEMKSNDLGKGMFLQTETEFGEILITRKDDLGDEICAIRMFSEAEVADSIILRVGAGTGILTEDGWTADVPNTAPSFIPVPTATEPATNELGRMYMDDGSNTVTGNPAMRQSRGTFVAYSDVMYHDDVYSNDSLVLEPRSSVPTSTEGRVYVGDGTNTNFGPYGTIGYREGSSWYNLPPATFGTWTPNLRYGATSVPVVDVDPFYFRVGLQITMTCHFVWTGDITAGGGAALVFDMPFRKNASISTAAIGTISNTQQVAAPGGYAPMAIRALANNLVANLIWLPTAGGDVVNVRADDANAAGTKVIGFSVTYLTNTADAFP